AEPQLAGPVGLSFSLAEPRGRLAGMLRAARSQTWPDAADRPILERGMVRGSQHSFVLALAASSLLAGSALAQTAAYSDVPNGFRIEAGGFRIGADTELTFNTRGTPKEPVNFESLNLPDNATRFYVEGFWRPWRRHEFSLSWYRNARDGDPRTSQRDFLWGDRVITAGATVAAHASSSYLSGVYRFAAYQH